jgi:trehalose 6-phosphate synthase/phosphatase
MKRRRLVIVSNRLPITTKIDGDQITFSQASGGLATGLRGCHERSEGVWIGWPGITSRLSRAHRTTLDRQLGELGFVPLYLTRQEVKEYYEDFSNGVLWPIFHYLVDRVPLGPSAWESYQRVNERFAQIVVDQYQPDDMIWVHDYQLLLVPGLLRQRLPGARIGFFLHIPFPASEVFRILPWRREILESLLGADLVGFHTYSYMQHFATALADLAGLEPEDGRVWLDDREVRFGVFPMGIDAETFRQLATSPAVEEELRAIRNDLGNRALLLGVDRLDYTKGLPRRMLALEALLQADPDLRDHIRLIQVAVPSRDEVPSYQEFRREMEGLIGRINGAYGTVTSVPIHYLHQSISPERLVALYRAANVMLVTPLRDGMNLVAKEYVASRIDDDGVLVLSEFAGASEELHEAVFVNAYDVRDLTAKITEALALGPEERATRMRAMRRRVMSHDVHRWANDFIHALESDPEPQRRPTPEAALKDALARMRAASTLAILLDYDGTLVPIAPTPDQAMPDSQLLSLISTLGQRPNTTVEILSGRARDKVETLFGALPIALSAEHGIWFRAAPHAAWECSIDASGLDWLADVHGILEDFTAATPGAFIEEKTASIAWHYRGAARGFGQMQARELRVRLSQAMVGRPVDILEGKKVLDIRPRGVNKAAVVQRLLSQEPSPALIAAFGDDRADEELFAALPPTAITLHVGPGASLATQRLRDPAAARAFLAALLD